MDKDVERLISAIESLSKFSINDLINILALSFSFITIVILIKDKLDSNRPYLQVSFELVRSSLACLTIRNVGKVPLVLYNLYFDNNFISQLPRDVREFLENNDIRNLKLFPGDKWIVTLGVNVFDILNNFNIKHVDVSYRYKKINGLIKYNESSFIDFEQYKGFLVYVSEMDELRKAIVEVDKTLDEVKGKIVKYCSLQDNYIKVISSK